MLLRILKHAVHPRPVHKVALSQRRDVRLVADAHGGPVAAAKGVKLPPTVHIERNLVGMVDVAQPTLWRTAYNVSVLAIVDAQPVQRAERHVVGSVEKRDEKGA